MLWLILSNLLIFYNLWKLLEYDQHKVYEYYIFFKVIIFNTYMNFKTLKLFVWILDLDALLFSKKRFNQRFAIKKVGFYLIVW